MTWTRFMDMNSGGGRKEAFDTLYIEAPKVEAEIIFYNRFGHSPHRVTCTCCGNDYSLDEKETLEELTEYDRKAWKTGEIQSLENMIETKSSIGGLGRDTCEFIFAKDIKDEERIGDVPEQGYVWKD